MLGTFSKTIIFGLSFSAALTIAVYKTLRLSSSSLFPAKEKPWQGGPPAKTSSCSHLELTKSTILSILSNLNRK